jgi:hypothetical protein
MIFPPKLHDATKIHQAYGADDPPSGCGSKWKTINGTTDGNV